MNAIVLGLIALISVGLAPADKSRTFIGWLSDESCATARATGGVFTPTNPDCAKRCIESGKAVVFISENDKALFKVSDYPKAKDDLGWHLELSGVLDEDTKTLSVQSVKRLEYQGAMCGRPTKSQPRR